MNTCSTVYFGIMAEPAQWNGLTRSVFWKGRLAMLLFCELPNKRNHFVLGYTRKRVHWKRISIRNIRKEPTSNGKIVRFVDISVNTTGTLQSYNNNTNLAKKAIQAQPPYRRQMWRPRWVKILIDPLPRATRFGAGKTQFQQILAVLCQQQHRMFRDHAAVKEHHWY